MSNKNFFLFFFIFIYKFVFALKKCEDVIIRKYEYDFELFKIGEHVTLPKNVGINNDIVLVAFDYQYLIGRDFYSNIDNQNQRFFNQVKILERKKIREDLLGHILDKIIDKMISKEDDKADLLQLIKDDKNMTLFGITEQDIKEYLEIKQEANSLTSLGKKELINLSLSSVTSALYALKPAISAFLAKEGFATAISSISTASFINPTTIGIFFVAKAGLHVLTKIYNAFYIESEIDQNKNEMHKYRKLTEKLNELIYDAKWVENNCVLTAISNDSDCLGYAVQFNYCKEVKYKSNSGINIYNDVILSMTNMTCTFRRNVCTDFDACENNLMKYVACLSHLRRGDETSCKDFTEDCKLKEKVDYGIYEL